MAETLPRPVPTARPILRVAVLARAVYPWHGYGGLERHVYDLVRHLVRRGISVTLVTRPPAAALRAGEREGPAGCSTIWVPYRTFPFAGRRGTTVLDRSTAYPWFGYRAGRMVARLQAAGQFDLVHGLGASALGYAQARARDPAGTAPFVFNPQGLEEFGGTGRRFGGSRLKAWAYGPLQIAVRSCARAADCVLATDRAIVPTVRDQLRVPPERIRVVPNAIDVEDCDQLADAAAGRGVRGELAVPEGEPLLVSVGRLEKNKGFHVLARALAHLRSARWRWVLVGAGPYGPTLERLVRALDLDTRVTFTGRVDARTLHAWYEAATLFVHPTLYEGSSLVTLEAMAHRRAVVATSAGGLPDKVRPGVTGWLVEPGSPDALAGAIREALAADAALERMGLAGRALVEAQFAWPVVADQLIAVYRELAGAE
jgi:glycosyltransferase involved in cell wall biosynthesis